MSSDLTPPIRVCIRKAELIKRGYTDLEDWKKNPKHLYIGRQLPYVKGATRSIWANPYKLSKYSLADSIKLYREHIMNGELKHKLKDLNNYAELGCWCDTTVNSDTQYNCHGALLIALMNELEQEKSPTINLH